MEDWNLEEGTVILHGLPVSDEDRLETINGLLLRHELNPDDWQVITCTVNTWNGQDKNAETIELHQIKVTVKPKVSEELYLPPRADGPIYRPDTNLITKNMANKYELAIFSDAHHPYHDQAFMEAS